MCKHKQRSEHLLVHMKITDESLIVLNGRGWASQPQLSRVIAHHHLVKRFKSAAPKCITVKNEISPTLWGD